VLHFETIKPGAFSILKELMELPALSSFQLVGGTALSLQLGHRMSDDLDLFSNIPFENEAIITALIHFFGDRYLLTSTLTNKLGIFGFIDEVKIDICRHKEELIGDIKTVDNIRMWSLEDIAASKVNAISRRATKKDFWDIDKLLDIFTIDEITMFYKKKYLPVLAITVAHMITFYTDAEDSATPNCLNGKTWEMVKKSIFKKINNNSK
jgi:Nucleotidyl transferase AbiEii toxin, Type IV TA system